jgi:hypothetical protein
MIRFFRDLKNSSKTKPASTLFVKTSLWLMLLSTIALFAMVPVMLSELRQSALYYGLVQFYLHFQFNGWYIFAVLALFLQLMHRWDIVLKPKEVRNFYVLLLISCFLTYALAVTWSTPKPFLFWTNSLGVIIQLLALVYFIKILKPHFQKIKSKLDQWMSILFGIAIFSFALKIVVQSAVVIPHIATVAYTIRNFVIGFIHLVLLACITSAILGFVYYKKWLSFENWRSRIGLSTLLVGIFLSELFLFGQGTMLWAGLGFMPNYYIIIFTVSLLIPLGLLMIILRQSWRSPL